MRDMAAIREKHRGRYSDAQNARRARSLVYEAVGPVAWENENFRREADRSAKLWAEGFARETKIGRLV